jgi:FkbM family methyltransferase
MRQQTRTRFLKSKMKLLAGASLYYSLFGPRGLILAAKSRLLRRSIQVGVAVQGIPYAVFLRLRTTDIALCRDILIDLQYHCQLARDPEIIVDAGANIGLASIFYANKYPNSKIIAIEPEASNFGMLLKNTKPYPNITAVRAGLWKEHAPLCISNDQYGNHAFQTREAAKSHVEDRANLVQGFPLAEVMTNFDISHIDLLKVDIEGAEKEVFGDSSAWIGRVGIIAIECHDWIKAGCLENVQEAAQDFDRQWTKGETHYFAREAYFCSDPMKSAVHDALSESSHSHDTLQFPLNIVQVM